MFALDSPVLFTLEVERKSSKSFIIIRFCNQKCLEPAIYEIITIHCNHFLLVFHQRKILHTSLSSVKIDSTRKLFFSINFT